MQTTTKVFAINRVKFFKIIEDSAESYIVGDEIEIAGVKSLEVTFYVDFYVDQKNLSGNEVIHDVYSKVKSLSCMLGFDPLADLSQNFAGSYQIAAEVTGMDEGCLFLTLMNCCAKASPEGHVVTGNGVYTNKKFTRNNSCAELLMDISLYDSPQALEAVTE